MQTSSSFKGMADAGIREEHTSSGAGYCADAASGVDGLLTRLGDGGPGEELERLQDEWRTLELRRSRLSERTATASGLSLLSLSAFMPNGNDRSEPPGSPTESWVGGGGLWIPASHVALEEEREALRAALSNRSRGGPLVAPVLVLRAPSPSNRAAEESRHLAMEEREREREWREKVRAIEEEKVQMRVDLQENQQVPMFGTSWEYSGRKNISSSQIIDVRIREFTIRL